MTKHPLHPEIIDALSAYNTYPEAMQAAADWQLEQVIEWLRAELGGSDCLYPMDYSYIDVDGVLDDLKKAMRPTQQEQNS